MTIIVGTEGTGCSRAAVTWAAREARRRGDRLRIVHAFDGDRRESQFDIGNEFTDVTRVLAGAVVAAARSQALGVAPGLDVQTAAVPGPVVPTLLAEATGAQLLVLGHRDRVLPGSVGRRLAAEAPCPVVVVRGRETPDGSVLCEIDDSPAADAVLATAFSAADALGCGLVVLGARTLGGRTLDGRLAPWRERFPGVPAGTVHTDRTAALVAGSRDARLVVVGSARRRLLRKSGCPVLVAR
ncbi:universal stress protein [Actinoplanes sp. KI2]|uniref:universal stress protein n=1 Tax=Actinoplanes sp. KI2 TaxID=2983315 RepID=UPI0021D5A491|nr:universal stress protein [Actinoplanes sp. KI2]MCU7726251.1 universal stress protein [Actinoplanes sp. KI2]